MADVGPSARSAGRLLTELGNLRHLPELLELELELPDLKELQLQIPEQLEQLGNMMREQPELLELELPNLRELPALLEQMGNVRELTLPEDELGNPRELRVRRWENLREIEPGATLSLDHPVESLVAETGVGVTPTTTMPPMRVEWMFISVNIVLEILLVAMDQCASPSRPDYSLVAVVASFLTILVCIVEVSYKARLQEAGGVVICRRGQRRFLDSSVGAFVLVSGFAQFIVSLVAYGFYRRHAENPVKVSLVSMIFVICVAYSKLAHHCCRTTEAAAASLQLARDHQV